MEKTSTYKDKGILVWNEIVSRVSTICRCFRSATLFCWVVPGQDTWSSMPQLWTWLIDVQIREYTNHSSNIIVPKYRYRTHKDYATNY